jgi:hypothetical protein
MTWIAGYQDRRGCHDDSGEGTYADAGAWLLEQLDQRALMIESANDYDPVRDGDQVEELLAVRRYFQGLSEDLGGHELAAGFDFWLVSTEDRPRNVENWLRPRLGTAALTRAGRQRRQALRPTGRTPRPGQGDALTANR